jgi:hypothetical protein
VQAPSVQFRGEVCDLDILDDERLSAMEWSTPGYKRGEVDRAGNDLAQSSFTLDGSRERVLAVVDNWRSCHSYPLHALTMSLRARVRPIDQRALIAQRLKRLTSIASKLQREPHMKLSQMHDIGGCRAVVSNTLSLDALVARFEKGRSKCWDLYKKYDYIKDPKIDGYRGVHLVYRYKNDECERAAYTRLRIELQIRTQAEHAWATALETVDTFTRQALKANRGDPQWQRFFVLMGHSIALREGRSPVPGAPSNRATLIDEVAELAYSLNVVNTLQGWTAAIRMTGQRRQGHFFLLTLDVGNRWINIQTFPKSESATASYKYSLQEKMYIGNPDVQTVLVSVDSLTALRAAYPNYYMDTTAFVEVVEQDIAEVSSRAKITRAPKPSPFA